MKYLFALITFIGLSFSSIASDGSKKDTLYVKSSMVCEMCTETIGKALMYEKGIYNLDFDLKQNTIMVVYKPKKISAKEIEMKISLAGYKANGLAPDKEAFNNLHGCCKAPHD